MISGNAPRIVVTDPLMFTLVLASPASGTARIWSITLLYDSANARVSAALFCFFADMFSSRRWTLLERHCPR